MKSKDDTKLEQAYSKILLKENENMNINSEEEQTDTYSEYEIDNRDPDTTELILPNGVVVVVNPFELVENVLENADREDLIEALSNIKNQL
jgi:hypothetical protein